MKQNKAPVYQNKKGISIGAGVLTLSTVWHEEHAKEIQRPKKNLTIVI